MEELGLIIDLYQSPIQEESALKRAISDFYVPLIKILKMNKDITVSLNIPLCTLDLWDSLGYEYLISDIKEMHENERVEILGSTPYGLPLLNTPKKIIEDQVMLNEYGLGYFLGSRQGFEGEPAIMIKDVIGFYPPFSVIDKESIKTLSDLEYGWVCVDGGNFRDFLGGDILRSEGKDFYIVKVFNDLNDILGISFDDKNSVEGSYLDEEKRIVSRLNDLYALSLDRKFKSLVFRMGNFNNLENKNIDYKKLINGISTVLDYIAESKIRSVSAGNTLSSIARKNKTESNESNNFLNESIGKLTNDDSKYNKLNEDISSWYLSKSSVLDNNSDKYDNSPFKVWNYDELNKIKDTQYHLHSLIITTYVKITPLLNYYYVIDPKSNDIDVKNKYESVVNLQPYVSEILSHIDDIELNNIIKDFLASYKDN